MTDSERFQVSQGLHLDGEAWYLPRSPGRMSGRAGRRHGNEWRVCHTAPNNHKPILSCYYLLSLSNSVVRGHLLWSDARACILSLHCSI